MEENKINSPTIMLLQAVLIVEGIRMQKLKNSGR
jgi:hypothetical protein